MTAAGIVLLQGRPDDKAGQLDWQKCSQLLPVGIFAFGTIFASLKVY
jgi:hypothetical protein